MNDVVINGIAIKGFLILLISAMCSGSSVLICCDSSNITKRVNSSAPMVEGVITGLVEFFEISFVSTAAENRHFAFFCCSWYGSPNKITVSPPNGLSLHPVISLSR